jgi:nucleotide-binding universal stress UspA family protein
MLRSNIRREPAARDLIIMAPHGRKGIIGELLGSETARVVTNCKIQVLVYR